MRKSRFSDSQILAMLKQNEQGLAVGDICREHGVSSAQFYKWRSKFGGMDASELKRIRALEEENTKLKRLYADVSLENMAMKDLFSKKGW